MPSTVIRQFQYDAAHRTLEIEFVSGRRYRYGDVPEGVVERFRAASSRGRFFNIGIRDVYAYEELEPAAGHPEA